MTPRFDPPGVKLKFMRFGGFFLIGGPGRGRGKFPPPLTPPLPDSPPPPGASLHITTCAGGFGAGPGGAFPAGFTGSGFSVVAGARFSVDAVQFFTIFCYLAQRKRVQKFY